MGSQSINHYFAPNFWRALLSSLLSYGFVFFQIRYSAFMCSSSKPSYFAALISNKNISGTTSVSWRQRDVFFQIWALFCDITFPHARQWCRLHVRVNSQVQIIHMVVRGSGIHIGALDPKGAPSSKSLSSTWGGKKNPKIEFNLHFHTYTVK